MTTAYWCVFIIIIMAYSWALLARLPGLTLERNLVPRIASNEYSGVKQRIYWAHLNAMEAIAPFTAAIVITHLVGVPQSVIDTLALTFVAFRLLHAACYIANLGVLRTIMFIGGMACIITLFIKAV